MRLVWIVLLTTGFAVRAPGQVQRILHQEFALSDSITEIKAELYGDYKVETWPGNNILLESQIKLYNASEGIIEHLMEIGRYELLSEYQGTTLFLTARDLEHQTITTSRGESFEDLQQRLFIPADFKEVSSGHWQRPAKVRKRTVVPPRPGGDSGGKPNGEGLDNG